MGQEGEVFKDEKFSHSPDSHFSMHYNIFYSELSATFYCILGTALHLLAQLSLKSTKDKPVLWRWQITSEFLDRISIKKVLREKVSAVGQLPCQSDYTSLLQAYFFLCLLKSLLCKFNWDKIWALLGLPLLCLTPVSPYWRALKGWSAELTKKTRRWLSELMPLLWNWTSILQLYLTSALSIPVRWEGDTSTTTRSWMAALGQGRMLKEHGKFSSWNG